LERSLQTLSIMLRETLCGIVVVHVGAVRLRYKITIPPTMENPICRPNLTGNAE
jgi:hypothetical protein